MFDRTKRVVNTICVFGILIGYSASKIRSCKYNYRIKFEFLMGLEFFNLEGFQIVAFLVRKLLIDR